jgi:hypothetical protein
LYYVDVKNKNFAYFDGVAARSGVCELFQLIAPMLEWLSNVPVLVSFEYH